MAKPSVSMPDELLEEFDKTMRAMKRAGELDMETRRSEVIRELMGDWLKENQEFAPGNFQLTIGETTTEMTNSQSQSKMSS